jgi:catechol 2,3-dioxygenase-like lactoylglutathione lyase family enzyme
MANISGPDFITILVSDLKASYNFYKEKIGLSESAEKRPNAHAFQTKPCGLAIRQSSDDRENRKSRPRNHPLVAHLGRNCLTS